MEIKKAGFGTTKGERPDFTKSHLEKANTGREKSILDKLIWQSDYIQDVFKLYLNIFKESDQFKHISFLKNSRKFKMRIVFPTFVLSEKDLSKRNNQSTIDSIMYFTAENAAVYLADKKQVYYRINLKKIRGKWNLDSIEFIPLTLSNTLIQNGLFNKKQEHIAVYLLQNGGRLKSILIMNLDKKPTYLDPENFFNNYQTSFPN